MTERKTSKKVTRVEGGESAPPKGTRETFVPTAESKGKATQLRIFGVIAWLLAIGFQIGAILLLFRPPVNMTWLIILIVLDLIFVVIGSLLWKKSNRLDPASEKNKIRFFIQNQLGLVAAIIAFLPLVIFIFTSKNLDKKQKGIAGAVAVVALLIAGVAGIDFNPPSVEQYTEESEYVQSLTGGIDFVYWTKSGRTYHIYEDCSYINTDRTTEIFEGTVAQAHELKNITNLCSRCEGRAKKDQEETEPVEIPAEDLD